MTLLVATVALLAGIAVWWMTARRLTSRPWEGQRTLGGWDESEIGNTPAPGFSTIR